jgi:predicted dehydrogenase
MRASASLDDLLADPEVDAVYVATPNDSHAEISVAAAAAGKHVLCEKPMAATLAQAETMAAAFEGAGVAYGTAFDQRFHPAHRTLRDLVTSGRLGTVTAARIVYACWLGPDWAPDNWRADPDRAGGGALLDLAPHGLDLLQVLLGSSIEELMALKQRRVHSYDVDDGAALIARFEDGTLATLHVAYNHPETLPRRRLELVGTHGLAVATDTMGQDPGGSLRFIPADEGAPAQNVAFGADSPFTAQLDAFSSAVLDGRPLPSGPDHDLRLMRLLEPWR